MASSADADGSNELEAIETAETAETGGTVGRAVGGIVRALSGIVTRPRDDDDDDDVADVEPRLMRRESSVGKNSAPASAMRSFSNAVKSSERMRKIERQRENEECDASDEEEEDIAFKVKRDDDEKAKPVFSWSATMKRRVDEIELEASEGGDAEEGELQWVGSLRDRVREIEQEAKYVGGEPTERTKSLSRINVLNAPVGEGGQPKRTQFEEDRPKEDIVEDFYYDAVMGDKVPAYKKPRRHIARLANLDSAVLDQDGEQLSVWSTTMKDLDVLGPGIGLWFAQLKSFGWMFMWLTLLAAVAVAHYVQMSDMVEVEVTPEVTTTLGITAASKYAKKYGIDIRMIMAVLSCFDVLTVLIFMLVTAVLARKIRSFVIRVDEQLLTLADFSLQVTGLPIDTTEEEVREHFEEFGQVADVVIARSYGGLLRLRMRRARLFQRAERLKADLSAIRHELKKIDVDVDSSVRYRRVWRKFYKTRDEIIRLKDIIEERMKNEFKIVYGFVTFEQEADKITCQDEYAAYFSFFRTDRTKFRVQPSEDGRNHTYSYLRVKNAIEASDILWENMANVSWRNYAIRKTITTFVVAALLIGNIVLVVFTTSWLSEDGQLLVDCDDLYSTTTTANPSLHCPAIWSMTKDTLSTNPIYESNKHFRSQANNKACPSFIESATWKYNMTQYAPYTGVNASLYTGDEWAGGLDTTTLADECAAKVCYDCMCRTAITSGSVSGICKDYYYDQLMILGFEVTRLTIVAVTSVILLFASEKCALFERHKTVSATETATSRFAFFTLITNALVLPLLVNVQIKGLSDFPILFQGAFHDVTIDWYATVFNSLMISAFINAAYFGPSRIIGMWFKQLWRSQTAHWSKTQYAMNKLYERPKFTLAERYGQAMTVIYTSVVLFSAAPVLIPAAALYALLAYWSDKALILLYCRYPALYDHKLAVQFLKFAPLACLCHFAFASWVFSQWDVPSYFVTGFKGWDEDLVSQHDSDFWTVRANMTQYAQFDFQERFYRVNGLIQLIPLMMYFVYLTTKAVLGGVGTTLLYMLGCARCVRDEWRADVQYANFSDARDKAPTTDDPDEMAGMLAGLPSYRVQDNPEYASLFPEASNIERRLEKSDTWGHDRDDEAPAGMGWGKYASGKE